MNDSQAHMHYGDEASVSGSRTPCADLNADFIAKLGHELRTPLTAILGYTEILKMQAKTYLPKEQYHQLEIIERSGHAMLRLISNVLDWSRLEAGRVEREPQTFNVVETFQNFVESMLVLAAAKGLGFSLSFAETTAPSFVTDPYLLRQIFANLVTNAIKYTERGGITVHVSASDEELTLAVIDTGPGIARHEHPRIFEEFQRVTPGTKDGTGLGLAISRGLVDVLGGRIMLDSEPGAGCRFEVRLPRLAPGDAPLDEPLPLPFPGTRSRAQVLVIDDDPDNRELISSYLSQEGMSVTTLEDGSQCTDAVLRLRPDLVIMDMMMPGVDGFEATRRLREFEATRSLPIICLTALSGAEIESRALAAGCNQCLTKPLDFRRLSRVIQQCLAEPASQAS